MKAKDRVKMCPYCEGNVSFEVESCPYCGSDLVASKRTEPIQKMQEVSSFQDHLEALYRPPYMVREKASAAVESEEEDVATDTPSKNAYQDSLFHQQLDLFGSHTHIPLDGEESKQKNRFKIDPSLWSILLITLGTQLLVLSLVLLLFSDHGRVVLEWKSRYWLLYLILSLPALYFGYQFIEPEDPPESHTTDASHDFE